MTTTLAADVEKLVCARSFVERMTGEDVFEIVDKYFLAFEMCAKGIAMMLGLPIEAARDLMDKMIKPAEIAPGLTLFAVGENAER